VYARAKDQLGRWLTARPVITAVTAALLILIPHVLTRAMLLRMVTTPFGHTLQAVGVGILVMQSVFMPAKVFYRILNWPMVSGLGMMSYSLYVWQQIFSTRPLLLGLRREWWMSFPGWLVPSLAVALISYFVLERPFIRLRARLRPGSAAPATRVNA
jgi:peptidoglycan/LPS O-acetylase OafA/YrhL